MIYVFLANGYEETEAIAAIDVLKRAGLSVTTVAVEGTPDYLITGSHGITVKADMLIDDMVIDDNISAVVLPGGMPGTVNLESTDKVLEAIRYCADNNKIIAAICAAPSILGHMGILAGKKATCFPGFERELESAVFTGGSVTCDGNIITADGAGSALKFGEAIAAKFVGGEVARSISDAMQCRF